jgi:predicted transcriptional regulator
MTTNTTAIEIAAGITIAWLSNENNRATIQDVPAILQSTYISVLKLASVADDGNPALTTRYTPAVSVRKSLASRDHIISLLDGKPYKMLRRHLANNGLTPEQYRERYGLKPDYPIVSESYSETRRVMAIKNGFGRTSHVRSKKPV